MSFEVSYYYILNFSVIKYFHYMYVIHFQGLLAERDATQNVYDHMVAEAHHLGDKPGVSGEMDTMQQRWSQVTNTAEDKAHGLQKVIDTWKTFQDQTQKLGGIAEKFESKLKQVPDVHAVDAGALENELAMYKVTNISVCVDIFLFDVDMTPRIILYFSLLKVLRLFLRISKIFILGF